MDKIIGLYVIIEPAIRNLLQVSAATMAISSGMVLVGLVLILWAVADTGVKAYTGAQLMHRKHD